MQGILSDEEKQELIYFKKLAETLQIENNELKEQINKYKKKGYEQKEEVEGVKLEGKTLNKNDFNKKIIKLCSDIEKHRMHNKGECWFFGIKNLLFDYGEVWSSPTYWDSLIKSNPVNEKFCLFNFVFQKKINICDKCSKTVDSLNILYSEFLDNLKKEYMINEYKI